VTFSLTVGAFTPSVLLSTARRLGRLEEHGLAVEQVLVPSSPAQFRSLADGELDVALTSPDNVLAYRFDPANPLAQLLDARIVSAVDRGMGLALYGRPGLDAETLRGARLGVDVPTSGFALAMYALAESLGVPRDDYQLVTMGSTPKRLEALLAGGCDAAMLNAGNELFAEQAGCVVLARASEVCAPYLGTVVSVVGPHRLAEATALARALRDTATAICSGAARELAIEEAGTGLGLPADLAMTYVDRLGRPDEGLILDDDVPLDALANLIELRQRYLPSVVDGRDVLADALDPSAGLLATAPVA
jgi:ABC-type nitrate/sulfonate/bicarbonate transport system substrate-binding protein